MLAAASRNPIAVCNASALPTRPCGASSLTAAENWAESATTEISQMTAANMTKAGCAPKSKPVATALVPLTAIAADVVLVLPIRSASKPAATQPAAPPPITKADARLAAAAVAG